MRKASARAIAFFGGTAGELEFSCEPPRIMKTRAAARLESMATKAATTRYFMFPIILFPAHGGDA